MFITDLGHDQPTILLTNDRKTSAAKVITRYAQRMLIENALSDVVRFFHMNALTAREATPGRNLATKALGYALNQEAELLRVLDDINLPLDNTRSERALRKIVMIGSLCISPSSAWNSQRTVVRRFATRAGAAAA